MKICVLTHPGWRGSPEPRALRLGARRVPVVAVLERWQGRPAEDFFRVSDPDGRRFVLRHDRDADCWELEGVYGPARAPAGADR